MPVITSWLPEHEVPRGRLEDNLMRAWSEPELIAKHCRLFREIKQMLGELVALKKHEKVSLQLFDTYHRRINNKGLPKKALPDDTTRTDLLRGAKAELKTYRAFHKRKMERFKKMQQVLKTYIKEWQELRKEVRQRLVADFNWQKDDIPDEVTVPMHLSHPKWEKCNRWHVEQLQQKYDYARTHFDTEEERNSWIVASEKRMAKNISQGESDKIDEVMEMQDSFFGPEMSDYFTTHRSGNTVSYTEFGKDGLPVDMHFDLRRVNVDADDLLDIF